MLVIKENSRCTSEVLFYGIWRRIPNVGGHSGSRVDSVIVDAVFYDAHAFSFLFFSEVDMFGPGL